MSFIHIFKLTIICLHLDMFYSLRKHDTSLTDFPCPPWLWVMWWSTLVSQQIFLRVQYNQSYFPFELVPWSIFSLRHYLDIFFLERVRSAVDCHSGEKCWLKTKLNHSISELRILKKKKKDLNEGKRRQTFLIQNNTIHAVQNHC